MSYIYVWFNQIFILCQHWVIHVSLYNRQTLGQFFEPLYEVIHTIFWVIWMSSWTKCASMIVKQNRMGRDWLLYGSHWSSQLIDWSCFRRLHRLWLKHSCYWIRGLIERYLCWGYGHWRHHSRSILWCRHHHIRDLIEEYCSCPWLISSKGLWSDLTIFLSGRRLTAIFWSPKSSTVVKFCNSCKILVQFNKCITRAKNTHSVRHVKISRKGGGHQTGILGRMLEMRFQLESSQYMYCEQWRLINEAILSRKDSCMSFDITLLVYTSCDYSDWPTSHGTEILTEYCNDIAYGINTSSMLQFCI